MLSHAVIIALIPGCVEVAKRSGLPSRLAPLAAVLFGILLDALSRAASGDPISTLPSAATSILTGLITGLAAVGLYEVMPRSASRSDDTTV